MKWNFVFISVVVDVLALSEGRKSLPSLLKLSLSRFSPSTMTTKCEICAIYFFFGLAMKQAMKHFCWFKREISQFTSTPFKHFLTALKFSVCRKLGNRRSVRKVQKINSKRIKKKREEKAFFVCVSLRNLLSVRSVHIFVAVRIIIIIKPYESKKSKERFNGMKSAMRLLNKYAGFVRRELEMFLWVGKSFKREIQRNFVDNIINLLSLCVVCTFCE